MDLQAVYPCRGNLFMLRLINQQQESFSTRKPRIHFFTLCVSLDAANHTTAF